MDSDASILLIIAAGALLATGFTVVPLLPGTIFVPLAAAGCALVVGWDEFAWWFWALQATLVAGYLLVDNLAQLLGVKRAGGSRQAMVGGAIGVFVGPILLAFVFGPLALLVGPPIGAVAGTLIGEERARRRAEASAASVGEYRRLGIGALVAYAVGTATKLALVAIQVALLVAVTR